MWVKTGMMVGIKSGCAKMATVFQIDRYLINYSSMMTYCQSGTSRVGREMKFGTVTNNDMGSSNITSIFEIDTFLINYS